MEGNIDLVSYIKEAAHEEAESYLLSQSDMNDSIFLKASNEELNEEIIKRICELSNQNVYLALFNDPNTNKANIVFEMADSSKILNKLKKSENDMKEYKIVPVGFKTKKAVDDAKSEAIEQTDFQQQKLAEFDQLQYGKQKLELLLKSTETMKTASVEDTKDAFSKIFHDAKLLATQGNSIADMAKIAMRHVQDENLDIMKIAKVYDLISTELKNSGYSVNEELTKTSSLALNKESKILKPIIDYSVGINKIAGFSEICDSIKTVINKFDEEITKTAGVINSLKSSVKKIIGDPKIAIRTIGLSTAGDIAIGGTSGALASKHAIEQDKKNNA